MGVSGLEVKPKTAQPTKRQPAEATVTQREGEFNRDRSEMSVPGLEAKNKTTQPTEKQPGGTSVTRREKKSKRDSKLPARQPGKAVVIRMEVKYNWEWYISGLEVKPKTTQPTKRQPALPTITHREGKFNRGPKGMVKDQLDLMAFEKAHPRGLDFKC